MKVKCYAIFDSSKEILSEYTNPSQKSFLDYELTATANKILKQKKSNSINYQTTSNGVWYTKINPEKPNNSRIHLVLVSQQFATISLATSIITQGLQLQNKSVSPQKLKVKIAELIRLFNANDSRYDKLNSNITELQGIMKNNVKGIMDNMTDLSTAQRKSDMMSSLSMQLEKDSKALEQKMKRRKFLMKLFIFGITLLFCVIVGYIIFG